MTRAPSRDSKAGQTYLALRKKARAEGRTTDELFQLAALESFVDRLSTSARASDLVLKGGVLLAAYDARRPTRDVDLSAQRISNDLKSVSAVVAEILTEPRDDGWVYGTLSAETIREGNAYSGVRVTVPCELSRARIVFHIDVNVGDVIWPPAAAVRVPRLLDDTTIAVSGYSLSMILAEKLVTAVQRGTANTRWRDFADVYLLTGMHELRSSEVRESIRRVAVHRTATLSPLATIWSGFPELAQRKWAAWVRKQNLSDRLPVALDVVLVACETFADPLMTASDSESVWNPTARSWVVI